ncbi:MAG TPA: peptide chain release factor N(5)-glutamine methyltransferase [Candidatus Cybelea sp.]|nr:peptide chain release factor N(5)-glutamine methyltransferase [Candidatus Cybelea sp.]
MSAGEAFEWGLGLLSVSSESARTDTRLLLAHAVGQSRTWAVAHPEAPLPAEEARAFVALCERRRAGVPIAYLLGSAGFCGREFVVDESVLVPRPETEHLVEEALEFIRERIYPRDGPPKVLDVGTGSGAIACTIASETAAKVDATDVSKNALTVAIENARRLGVSERCRFCEGDLVEPVRGNRYDVVIANLPYVPSSDLRQAPDPTAFEPRLALDGGPDGLALYRRLLPQIPQLLTSESLVLLEAAPPTIPMLKELLQRTLPNFAISIGHDYAGLARYIKAAAGVP